MWCLALLGTHFPEEVALDLRVFYSNIPDPHQCPRAKTHSAHHHPLCSK